MKTPQPFLNRKFLIISAVLFTFFSLNSYKSYGQIDYMYGKNLTGFRVSAGVGLTILETHFTQNTLVVGYVGNFGYDFSPYLNINLEGQKGTLQGIDAKNHLPVSSSTNNYYTGTFNVRAAVGQFYNLRDDNKWREVLKRTYFGVGVGVIKNDIVLGTSGNPNNTIAILEANNAPRIFAVTFGKYLVVPFNLGTNIDLPGVLGLDTFSINPNYQFNYIDSPYADGFISGAGSKAKAGYYNFYSVSLTYKIKYRFHK